MKYKIKFKNNKIQKNWSVLAENMPEAMERCRNFVEETPLDRLRSKGKLKKLKGEYEGVLQYDITDSARIRYVVDINNHDVYVEYVGGHP